MAVERRRLRGRHVLLIGALLAAVIVAGVGGLLTFGAPPSLPAEATVNGIEYRVGVGRSIDVAEADLEPAGTVSSSAYDWAFAEPTAYQLRGVDPRAALLVRAKPGLRDDAGPWGEFMILWGPEEAFPALCRYFSAEFPSTPIECRSGGPNANATSDAPLSQPREVVAIPESVYDLEYGTTLSGFRGSSTFTWRSWRS
jgi:hypothetical protein